MISKCYADAVDDQFQQICSGTTLQSQSVRHLSNQVSWFFLGRSLVIHSTNWLRRMTK
jgi:hypothetical protein